MTAAFAVGVLATLLAAFVTGVAVRSTLVAAAVLAFVLALRFVRDLDDAERVLAAHRRLIASTARALKRPLETLEEELSALRPRVPSDPSLARAVAGQDAALARLDEVCWELEEATTLSAGIEQLALERVDLARLAREVSLRVGRKHGAALPLDVDAPGQVTGEWDRARLEEVVSHLVSNAVKFGHGRRVRVRVRMQGGLVARLTVEDHGAGIAPDERARLFEPFARTGSSGEGLGLGLFIVRRIVAAHGGTVRVESEPGLGSRFTVELPRGSSSPRPAAG